MLRTFVEQSGLRGPQPGPHPGSGGSASHLTGLPRASGAEISTVSLSAGSTTSSQTMVAAIVVASRRISAGALVSSITCSNIARRQDPETTISSAGVRWNITGAAGYRTGPV